MAPKSRDCPAVILAVVPRAPAPRAKNSDSTMMSSMW